MKAKQVKDMQSLRVAVLGSGYIGLPTAALFADIGFTVIAVDINLKIVESVNNGVSLINEPGLQELVSRTVQAGKLEAALYSGITLSQEDVIVICVQTPVGENKEPNLSFLMNALKNVGENLKRGMLVVICSTVPPRTIREKVKPLLESLSGLKADIDFYLAYVPERIAPGKALKEFVESPRLAGGIGPNSTKKAAQLFRTVCKKIVETDVTTAEIAKTAENTFRDVNIAFANQLALICEQHGADITKVVELANTHPRVNIHASGPGVGGPCLTKDPYLLVYQTVCECNNIITTARNINDYMPQHVINLLINALKKTNKNVKTSRVAILGISYKGNVADSRMSPSEPIIHKLLSLGFEIIAYDPHCSTTFGAKKGTTLDETIKGVDCLIIVTDHTEFKNLNLAQIKMLMNKKPIIIDGKRIIKPAEAVKIGFTYYGVGYGKLHFKKPATKQARSR